MDRIAKRLDCDKNGQLSDEEFKRSSEILDLELREEKANTQKSMAWFALISMIVFTIFLFTPLIPVVRVEALADLISFFYIAQAGIVGAWMGVTSWMSKS